MGVNIKNHNLEHTDRLGKKQSSRTKPRPVFVKFVRYNDRRKVFSIKKWKLLTIQLLKVYLPLEWGLLANVREELGFRNAWTLDGRIIYINESSQKPKGCYD